MRKHSDNKEVAHWWANQTQAEGHGSNFFFRGSTIYSYGPHFPIARHYKGAVLFTTDGYSDSTSRHKGIAYSAIPDRIPVFHVEDPTHKPSARDLKHYRERIAKAEHDAGKARKPAWHLERLTELVKEANDFAKYFGFKTHFPPPANLAALQQRAKASAAKEKAAAKARQAKTDAENAEKVQHWIAGEHFGEGP